MVEWLVIHLLNKLASCLCKGELFFKVIKRNSNIAANLDFGLYLIATNMKFVQKYRTLYPDSVDTLNS